MNIVVKNLDCWNLWLFLTSCSAIYNLLGSERDQTIVIMNLGLPHPELVEKEQYPLKDLFCRIFNRQNIVVDTAYRVRHEDYLLEEGSGPDLFLPRDRECVNPVHRAGFGFIRSQLLRGFDSRAELSGEPRILFISRSTRLFNEVTENHPHWRNRVIKNNQAIKAMVREKYGGEVFEVDKENLPTAMHQLNIIRHADILFGIHGAGLNWIIAAKNRAYLYEFFPANSFQFNGINLCRNLGLGYHAREVEHSDNTFDLEQVFEGLNRTIELWKGQAPN